MIYTRRSASVRYGWRGAVRSLLRLGDATWRLKPRSTTTGSLANCARLFGSVAGYGVTALSFIPRVGRGTVGYSGPIAAMTSAD